MNAHHKIQHFSCPTCGGHLGEAAKIDDVRAALTRPAWRTIFDLLARAPGRSVMRDTLIEALYGDRADGGPERADHVIKAHVSQLRRIIEPFGWTITVSRGGSGHLAQWKLIPTLGGA